MQQIEEFKLPGIFSCDKYVEVTIKHNVDPDELGKLILEQLKANALPVVIIDEREKK